VLLLLRERQQLQSVLEPLDWLLAMVEVLVLVQLEGILVLKQCRLLLARRRAEQRRGIDWMKRGCRP
jgi:hypothetical protein